MILELPSPIATGSGSLYESLLTRRSTRQYTDDPISIADLSRLLWSAQGVTGSSGERTTPSAGGLYSLHLHVLMRRVRGLESGVYSYRSERHSLKRVADGAEEAEMGAAGIGHQPWLADAAVVIGIAANLQTATEHFADQPPEGERGARYVYMESGALAQNAHLCATDLGLGFVLVAGFHDAKVKTALALPSHLEPTSLLCIGVKQG